MVDLNGDGIRDVISGGYPGELYLFAGKEDGTFRAGEELLNGAGEKVNVGGASVPFAVDWDRDGDLDLLVGNIDGEVHFIPNESRNNGLELGVSMKLKSGGEVIEVEMGDAGPCVADWDGDGNHDLLLGCGDGSVLCYRNTTGSGIPVLAAPAVLVGKYSKYVRDEGESGTHNYGARSKLCVTDWNGDGRDDLLMGIFSSETGEDPDLTPEEQAERDRVRNEINEIGEKYSPIFNEAQKKLLKELGAESYSDLTDEKKEEYSQRFAQELEKLPEWQEYNTRMRELSEVYMKYRAPVTYNGWVWVFLRK